jgi:hypothetical protein
MEDGPSDYVRSPIGDLGGVICFWLLSPFHLGSAGLGRNACRAWYMPALLPSIWVAVDIRILNDAEH